MVLERLQSTNARRLCGATGLSALLTLPLSFAGCAVGPDFRSPAPPAGSSYTSPAEASAADGAGPGSAQQTLAVGEKVAADWWTLFGSPDLDTVVKQAIDASPTLAGAKERLTQAREATAAASSALYPNVDVGMGVTRGKVSFTQFGLPPDVFPLPSNFNLLQVGAAASYTLDVFGGTHRKIEQQAALVDFQRDRLDAAYWALTGNTVVQAVQIAALRAQLKSLGDVIEIDRQNLDLVRKERDAGAVPDSDVIGAESQLAHDQTLLPQYEQQLSIARHALAVLLGRAPADWAAPDFELSALRLPAQLPIILPSELVHQRPDIQAAEAQLHAASAEIGIATARLYPAITLSGDISSSAFRAHELFNPAGLVWSIAAGITEPAFDGGRRRAERRAALAAFRASAAEYQQTVLQAFGQVADILQALAHDAGLLSAEQHALEMASESVRLQRISYTRGGTGLINLLDAQRQYQQALLGYTRAQALRYQDTTQLLVAMGGGWWNQTPAARLGVVSAVSRPCP
jgi:NodT family efflux transporter outer membrane factor (OMF) lipoprotein